MMIVRGAFPGPIIVFMKPLSIMDARAVRPTKHGTICTKPARIATHETVAGGMRTVTAGTQTVIGMITTTIGTIANILPANLRDFET